MDKRTEKRIARRKRGIRIKKKLSRASNLLKAISFTLLGVLCTFEQPDYKAFAAIIAVYAIIKTWR